MRFTAVWGSVVLAGLVVLSGAPQLVAQDGALGHVARRDPAPADDDFLPLPEESDADAESSWWKPTLPKLTPPKISMPKIERPQTPQWVKKMNSSTREAVDKTRSAMTAPFQPDTKKKSPARRSTRQENKPGFWSRMFSSAEEPARPTTVDEWIGSGERLRPGG